MTGTGSVEPALGKATIWRANPLAKSATTSRKFGSSQTLVSVPTGEVKGR